MIVKKLRLERGWSQEHLSQLSGISVRTIQRIEKGQKAGLESLKSLAAVFEIQITELQQEPDMTQETQAVEDNSIAKFHSRLITYTVVIGALFIINLFTNPDYIWAVWPALGWGIGIILRGLKAYKLIS